MPIVTISKKPKFGISQFDLRVICDEVVTFALNTEQGPLQPGSAMILINDDNTEKKVDLVIQIRCWYFEDRYDSCHERADLIRSLIRRAYIDTRTDIQSCSADIKIAVCMSYDIDAWSKSKEPTRPKVEMTETAMMARIQKRCGFITKS